MGIKHITQLLKDYQAPPITHKSETVYLDGTFVLIKYYLEHSEASELDLYDELNRVLGELATEYKFIHFFLDIHYITKLDYKPKYIIKYYPKSQKITKKEQLESMPFVVKDKVFTDGELNTDKLLNYPVADVLCGYEMHSRDFNFRNLNIDNYISVPAIARKLFMETTTSQSLNDKILSLKRAGWNRYLVKKLGKNLKQTSRRNYKSEHTYSFDLGAFIAHFPENLDKINPVIRSKIKFYGCAVDAELALVKHLKMYNRNTFAKVITCDTDLMAHLCDIDCNLQINIQDDTFNINPKEFWGSVLGDYLNGNIIKIICVLLGTDYNFKSKLCINKLDELLKLLNITHYNEITMKGILTYIETKSDELRYSAVHTTILAINIYLSPIESTIIDLENIHEDLF